MNSALKLTVLACALAVSGGTCAQTANGSTNIPPPNDIIRLPGSVTSPNMPVLVEPPRDDVGSKVLTAPSGGTPTPNPPVIRSLGSDDSTQGRSGVGGGTSSGVTGGTSGGVLGGTGGATTGTGVIFNGGANAPANSTPAPAQAGTHSVNGATSSAGSGGPTDIGGVNGATSSAGLNGGITPSSGGAGGLFNGNQSSDTAGTGALGSSAGTGGNANGGTGTGTASGGASGNPSSGSITAPGKGGGTGRSGGGAAGGGK